MIRQDLGASLLYENFLDGLTLDDLTIRHISEKPFRTIVLLEKLANSSFGRFGIR